MSFLTIAIDALEETREVLKPTLKSANKTYYPSGTNMFALSTWKDKLAWATATEEEKRKWNRRNENQVTADLLSPTSCCPFTLTGLTPVEAGRKLYYFACTVPSLWYGNCGAQALVALYLCFTKGVAPEELWLIKFAKGTFSHELVMLYNDQRLNKTTYCDPWMNIACPRKHYKLEADRRLREWTGQGKRLPLGERIEEGRVINPIWVEPSNDKILGFGDHKFEVRKAMNGTMKY